jgi:hypothetical protein
MLAYNWLAAAFFYTGGFAGNRNPCPGELELAETLLAGFAASISLQAP